MSKPRKQIVSGVDPVVDKEMRAGRDRHGRRSLAVLNEILDKHPEVKRDYLERLNAKPWLVNRAPDVEYSEDAAQFILEVVAKGSSLRKACMADGMPDVATFLRWTRKDETLAQQYALACLAKAQVWADELVDISDDSTNDYMEYEDDKGHTKRVFDSENMKRTAIRVDTRKWYLSKIMPKQFGDATMLKLADAEGRVLPAQAPTLNIIGISPPRRNDDED